MRLLRDADRQARFGGEDISDTIVAVLRDEPSWNALPADMPPSVRLNVAGDRFERHVTEQVSGLRTDVNRQLIELRADFNQRLTEQVSGVRVDFGSQLSALRVEIHQSLSILRVELIKWSFLFWVGQLAAMAGLLAYVLRASGR